MATVLAQQVDWNYKDFPHNAWTGALVEVNNQLVTPQLVEFGKASTGQQICIVTFDEDCRLDIWLDPNYPKSHLRDYAVWNASPFYNLTLSTCPEWRMRKCPRCSIEVGAWNPPDEIVVDLKFCERTDHKRMAAMPHAHIIIRNIGFIQKRLGVDA
jgi:hypothetical protein